MGRTVGVDLAAQPRTTAAAEIVWGQGEAQVRPPRLWCGNDELLELPWLRFEPGAQQAYEASEHAFDALIAALIARSAALGLTTTPQGVEQERAAAVEGWIHLPRPGSLAGLVAAAA